MRRIHKIHLIIAALRGVQDDLLSFYGGLPANKDSTLCVDYLNKTQRALTAELLTQVTKLVT